MGAQRSTLKKDPTTHSDVPNFKIIFIGDCGSGKTCIIERFINNKFVSNYKPTLKCDISNLTFHVNLPYDTLVSLSLWDTPGKEDIDLRSEYYKNVDAVIVVGDLTDNDFEQKAVRWRNDFFDIGKWTKHHYHEVNGVQLDNPESLSYKSALSKETPNIESTNTRLLESTKAPIVILVGTKLDCIWNEYTDVKKSEKIKELLCEVTRKGDFFTAIAVSNKWSDISVHRTVQLLIRRLLTPPLVSASSLTQISSDNCDEDNLFMIKPEMTLFTTCGIKEVDRLLEHAEKCYRHALGWRVIYGQNLSRLQVLCLDAGLSSVVGLRKVESVTTQKCPSAKETKTSMDQLFTELFVQLSINFGATELITQTNGRLCIHCEDGDKFENLEPEVVDGELQWSRKQLLQLIVHHFNDQVASTIQTIAADAPRLHLFFCNMDSAVRKAALNCTNAQPHQAALVEKALLQLMDCASQVRQLEKQVSALQQTVNVAINN